MHRLALAVLAALLLLPATAGASTTLTLRGAAVSSLRAQGVKLSAVAPARLRGSKLTLGARSATRAAVELEGGLRLRKGSRSLTVRGWRAALGARPALTALVGGKRRMLLRVQGSVTTSGDAIALKGARLTLTSTGASAIKRALELRRLRSGTFGRVTLSERVAATPTTPAAGGGGTPSTTPITNEPPLLERPASAIDVSAATITWRVRDSFVQYLNAGAKPDDGVLPVAPATADAPMRGCLSSGGASDALLRYQFHFPFTRGWYDPASGKAALYFGGTVHFGYADHTIDLNAGEPEIELNGASSRAIFRFNGSGGTAVGNKREVLMNLAVAGGPVAAGCSADPGPAGLPAVVDNGNGTRTYTLERVGGVIPDGAAETVFAGFYLPGTPFGWVTVSFTA